MTKELIEYFKNTSREQVLKDWESTREFDNVKSPTIEEQLRAMKRRRLGKQ